MSRFTLDSATEFLFGSCVHALSAGLPYPHNAAFLAPRSKSVQAARADDFAKAFIEAQETISDRERVGWVAPFFEFWGDKAAAPMKVVNAYIEPIVQEALEKKRLAGAASGATEKEGLAGEREFREDESLLDHLVSLTDGEFVFVPLCDFG